MDCSLPGFSVHGISQARILKLIAISFSRVSSWPKDQTCISCVSSLADGFFTTEPLGTPKSYSSWREENLIPRLNQIKNRMHCSILSKPLLNEMKLWATVASNHFLQKVNLSKYFIKIKLLTIPVFNFYARDLYLVSSMCFPGGASGKELACQCRRCKRPGFSPWVGKIPLSRAWQATPVFCLENPMDRGAWWVGSTGWQRVRQDKWLSMLACVTSRPTFIEL